MLKNYLNIHPNIMKVIIVGMGVQGQKRKKVIGKEVVHCIDKNKKFHFSKISDVPVKDYDAAILCVPDKEKLKLVKYCVKNNKHCLVEKPFLINKKKYFLNLVKKTKEKKLIILTAYNHRFEPSIKLMKNILKKNTIGKILSCRLFYGNGTADLVRKSPWRNKAKGGIVTDIGSHLFDICNFWFGNRFKKIRLIEKNSFFTKSPDHSIICFEINRIKVILEMTMSMWKNSFYCDIIGKKGSLHINSLGKWEKNTLILRKRKYPSGAPKEKKYKFPKEDKTWSEEYKYFKKLIKLKKYTNFKEDILYNKTFKELIK
tara:strand:+ start:732 stop:1676 length:945 start_codon:yes stop_codon:yes gene_type:complete